MKTGSCSLVDWSSVSREKGVNSPHGERSSRTKGALGDDLLEL